MISEPHTTPRLGDDLFAKVKHMPFQVALRWYTCVVVSVSALNFPEVLPEIWKHLSRDLVENSSHGDQFLVAQKLREALTKSCGIVGAARTGNSLRQLSTLIPTNLRESTSPRSKEDEHNAVKRGHALWRRIYARNPEFNPEASVLANPDYAFIVRDVLYGRIFSFDGILDDLETGYVLVSALIGMDCPGQTRHHMKGMLYNGATADDVQCLQSLCLDIARRLAVASRYRLPSIPSISNHSH